jgi:hypothetical protein
MMSLSFTSQKVEFYQEKIGRCGVAKQNEARVKTFGFEQLGLVEHLLGMRRMKIVEASLSASHINWLPNQQKLYI